MLERITALINGVIVEEDPSAKLSPEDVVQLIGEGSLLKARPFKHPHRGRLCLCAVVAFADLGSSPGGASGRHWVLDPIDGTRGFVGMRQYCVCLGMLQDGEVQLGVLGGPNLPQVSRR